MMKKMQDQLEQEEGTGEIEEETMNNFSELVSKALTQGAKVRNLF